MGLMRCCLRLRSLATRVMTRRSAASPPGDDRGCLLAPSITCAPPSGGGTRQDVVAWPFAAANPVNRRLLLAATVHTLTGTRRDAAEGRWDRDMRGNVFNSPNRCGLQQAAWNAGGGVAEIEGWKKEAEPEGERRGK